MKQQQGFSIMEVLIAMAIMTSTVYVLSDLHIRSMFRLMRERNQFVRFFMIKNELNQQLPLIKKDFKPVKQVAEDIGMVIQVDLVDPHPKSPLKDILGDHLALVQATGVWKDGPYEYNERLVSFGVREVPLEAKKP
jgi:prepilin-type N-terminal cleavage/methylation domain-containing protein